MQVGRAIAILALLGATGATVACSGDAVGSASDGASGGTGAEGASGGTGGSSEQGTGGEGTGSGGTSVEDCTLQQATGSPTLIDDLNDGDHLIPEVDGRKGSWYVVTDGTGAITPAAAGTNLECDPSYVFVTTDGKACITGGTFTDWGALIGLILNGGVDCVDCPYDASIYSGIRFTVSGTIEGRAVFQLDTTDTVHTRYGGTCEVEADCYDGFEATLSVSSTPATVELRFDELAQQGWGAAATWEPEKLLKMSWYVEPLWGASGTVETPGSAVDYCIDDVEFF